MRSFLRVVFLSSSFAYLTACAVQGTGDLAPRHTESQIERHPYDSGTETAPASGCNFYSNGDVVCASGCTGFETPPDNGEPGYVANITCGGNKQSFDVDGAATIFTTSGPRPGRLSPPTALLTNAEKLYNGAIAMMAAYSAKGSTASLLTALGIKSAGNECVIAVQTALSLGSLAMIADPNGSPYTDVDNFQATLPNDGYSATSMPNAGDIVIWNENGPDGHAGICLTNGCSESISNSSRNQSFTWYASPQSVLNYYSSIGVTLTVSYYHHK